MKKTYTLSILLLAALVVQSCKKDDDAEVSDTGKDLVLTAVEQQKVAADNDFHLNFLNK